MAGTAFAIRVTGAVIIFLSQILMARWMGSFEYGTYVYVWTWLLLIGDLVHLGLPLTAQRHIPEYTQRGALDGLRGFLIGSRWIVFRRRHDRGCRRSAALAVHGPEASLGHGTSSCRSTSPAWRCRSTRSQLHARRPGRAPTTLDRANIACSCRPSLLRPLMLICGAMAAARAAGLSASTPRRRWPRSRSRPGRPRSFSSSCFTAARRGAPARDRGRYDIRPVDQDQALPIFAVWAFYMLLTYTDVLVLRQFRPPEEVAHYYAAAKILALVTFIHFSVSAAVAHRFTAHRAAGESAALAALAASTVRWTFWPSLLAIALILAFGKPILWLFGPDFQAGYPLMFILAIALIARAAVGPAERVLNMLGEQRRCALVYATVFGLNLAGCLAVAGPYGAAGVAVVVSAASIVESALLFLIAKRRLGLHMLIWRPSAKA